MFYSPSTSPRRNLGSSVRILPTDSLHLRVFSTNNIPIASKSKMLLLHSSSVVELSLPLHPTLTPILLLFIQSVTLSSTRSLVTIDSFSGAPLLPIWQQQSSTPRTSNQQHINKRDSRSCSKISGKWLS